MLRCELVCGKAGLRSTSRASAHKKGFGPQSRASAHKRGFGSQDRLRPKRRARAHKQRGGHRDRCARNEHWAQHSVPTASNVPQQDLPSSPMGRGPDAAPATRLSLHVFTASASSLMVRVAESSPSEMSHPKTGYRAMSANGH